MKIKKLLLIPLSLSLIFALTACGNKPKTEMQTVCVDDTCFEMEMEVTDDEPIGGSTNTEGTSGTTGEATPPPVEEKKELNPDDFNKEEAVAIKAMQAMLKNDLDTLYELVYIEGDKQFVKKEDLEIYFMINDLGKYMGAEKEYELINANLIGATQEGSGYEKTVELTFPGNPDPVIQQITVKLLNKDWKILLPGFIVNDFKITSDITTNVSIDGTPILPKFENDRTKTFVIPEISGIKHTISCGNNSEQVLPGEKTQNYSCEKQ